MTIQRGDIIDKSVMIIKLKAGKPTVIAMDGRVYVWQPDDRFTGKGQANERTNRR